MGTGTEQNNKLDYYACLEILKCQSPKCICTLSTLSIAAVNVRGTINGGGPYTALHVYIYVRTVLAYQN